MIYRKNLLKWEQGGRVLLGVGLLGWALYSGGQQAWLWGASGGVFVLTGAFGFCPACYMVGRKSPTGGKVAE